MTGWDDPAHGDGGMICDVLRSFQLHVLKE